ncbi:uncharacterized protein LOC128721352 [Anopheles nili]|uniref:uncharacterized protein LOC128721352 n=1 Tax=Anopheles nili TaxID=185578 RepID=UPI00237BB6A2|nr:uncharacterized protein LOC128721352 [Anopheles nili]
MASMCISIIVITVLSMVSLTMCKPFLGDLLTRAIASSSTPDDPQSHISDFRTMSKMDPMAEKLKLVDLKENQTASTTEPEMEPNNENITMAPVQTTLWQRWNRTEFLARIIDDILKPAQERITLVFRTLVPRESAGMLPENAAQPKNSTAVTDKRFNSTGDDDTDELSTALELLAQENEPSLIDPPMNGSTLLSQLQARRNVLRRRVAKALSSITGLLILAANTRREAKSRSTRSIELPVVDDQHYLQDFSNDVNPYADELNTAHEVEYDDGEGGETSRRNMESFGIFILEVFGSIVGFSWGIFKQVQSFWL